MLVLMAGVFVLFILDIGRASRSNTATRDLCEHEIGKRVNRWCPLRQMSLSVQPFPLLFSRTP